LPSFDYKPGRQCLKPYIARASKLFVICSTLRLAGAVTFYQLGIVGLESDQGMIFPQLLGFIAASLSASRKGMNDSE
jgi:hypothetical protein